MSALFGDTPTHTWRASGATSSGSHCGTSRTARCAASGRLGAYAENLTRAITAKLEQLDLNVPVNVTIGRAPHGADLRYGTTPLRGENYSRIDDAIAAAIAEPPWPRNASRHAARTRKTRRLTGGRRISGHAPTIPGLKEGHNCRVHFIRQG